MMHAEDQESLWSLAAPLLVWLGHLLASYATAAIWCAKAAGGSFLLVRIAIAAYTVAALTVVGALGWRGFRQHRSGGTSMPHEADTALGRRRFLGFSAVLLSGLSAVAIVYTALVPLMIGSCR